MELTRAYEAEGKPLTDYQGRKTYVWDMQMPREKGYWRNLSEAGSQFFGALFFSTHANITTSAQFGEWQLEGRTRGKIGAWIANRFMWVWSGDIFRGRPIDHNHSINAWKRKA
jgi:hypothetical protein